MFFAVVTRRVYLLRIAFAALVRVACAVVRGRAGWSSRVGFSVLLRGVLCWASVSPDFNFARVRCVCYAVEVFKHAKNV